MPEAAAVRGSEQGRGKAFSRQFYEEIGRKTSLREQPSAIEYVNLIYHADISL
jgi:hypothetical protein